MSWWRTVLLVLALAVAVAGLWEDAPAQTAGNILFKGSQEGDVLFSHSRHVRLDMDCDECHPKIFRKRASGGGGSMEPLNRGESCGACHNGKRAFSVRNCNACHQVDRNDPKVRYKVPQGGGVVQLGDVTFSHPGHLDAGLRCTSCHPKPFPMKKGTVKLTMASMEAGGNCGACHNGRLAFSVKSFGDCSKCHSRLGTQVVQRDGVAFRHGSHTGRFRCEECHPKPFKMHAGKTPMTMAAMYNGQLCGKCHGSGKAFGLTACTKCHTNLTNYGGTIQYPGGPVGSARFSHQQHVGRSRFGCETCHPAPFRMQARGTGFRMGAMLRGMNCGSCHNGRTAFSAQSCSSCHNKVGPYGGYGARGLISWKSKTIGKVAFDHQKHMKGRTCASCHDSLFPMKSGTLTMAPMYAARSCGTCHNGKKAFAVGDCTKCHVGMPAPADVTYDEKSTGPVKFSHDNHLAMDFKCKDCHTGQFKPKVGASGLKMDLMFAGKQCARCHDGKKAFAVSDCRSCHSGDKVPADLTYKVESVGAVTFSHSNHVAMDLKCNECHTRVFKPKANGNGITMDKINAGKQCGTCHNGKKAFTASDCRSCHSGDSVPGDITYPEESLGPVTFSHQNHVGMDLKCTQCHTDVFKAKAHANKMTMDEINGGKFCGTCHDGKKAFAADEDCTKCHTEPAPVPTPSVAPSPKPSPSVAPSPKPSPSPSPSVGPSPKPSPSASPAPTGSQGGGKGPRDIAYIMEGMGPVTFSHGFHLGKDTKCNDCHPAVFKMKAHGNAMTMDLINGGKLCGTCHNGKRAFAADDCARCHVDKQGQRLPYFASYLARRLLGAAPQR